MIRCGGLSLWSLGVMLVVWCGAGTSPPRALSIFWRSATNAAPRATPRGTLRRRPGRHRERRRRRRRRAASTISAPWCVWFWFGLRCSNPPRLQRRALPVTSAVPQHHQGVWASLNLKLLCGLLLSRRIVANGRRIFLLQVALTRSPHDPPYSLCPFLSFPQGATMTLTRRARRWTASHPERVSTV